MQVHTLKFDSHFYDFFSFHSSFGRLVEEDGCKEIMILFCRSCLRIALYGVWKGDATSISLSASKEVLDPIQERIQN